MHDTHIHDEPVLIWTGAAMLEGRLAVPPDASALLLMVSGGATAAHNGFRRVANHLWQHGFAVLFADALTEDEQQFDSRTGHFRSDVKLLSERLTGITGWVKHESNLRELPVALFGTGSVAAAGLSAAALDPSAFAALILVEARTDLVDHALHAVETPVLLIAPDSDMAILRMNRDAVEKLRGEKRLEVIPDSARVIDDEWNVAIVAREALSWAAAHAQPVGAW
jgi:putative phosphoribosyl transferase